MSVVLIVPVKAPGKTVHLHDGQVQNGAIIRLWDRLPPNHKNFTNQLWVFDGTIFRSCKSPTKCLRLAAGQTRNATFIQLWNMVQKDHDDVLSQEWRLEGQNIVSRKKPSACWQLTHGGTRNTTTITLWEKTKKNHENGLWRLEKVDTKISGSLDLRRNACYIVPLKSPGQVVTIPRGLARHLALVLWERVPIDSKLHAGQVWLRDGNIFRSGLDTSMCIVFNGGLIKVQKMWPKGHREYPNQLWCLEGKNLVKKNTSKCWTVRRDAARGSPILLRDSKNHIDAFWKVEMIKMVPVAKM